MTRRHLMILGFLLAPAVSTIAAAPITPTYSSSATLANGPQYAVGAAQAGQIASRMYGGKVIDVKKVNLQGRVLFRVKLLQPNGRIHSVLIDASSGQPLS